MPRNRASVNVTADTSELRRNLTSAGQLVEEFGVSADDAARATGRAERELDKMEKSSRRTSRASKDLRREFYFLERRVSSMASRFTRALGGLALGGGAFGALINRLIDSGDSIVKTADRLGLTTEQLTAYRYAADLAGLSTRQFDIGFQRFARRLGQALQGSGELVEPLRRLGIAIRDVEGNARSSVEVFKDFADGIRDLVNSGRQQEALSTVFKGFDTEGVAFIELLKGGREELEKIPAAANEAGVVISRSLLDPIVGLKDTITSVRSAIQVQLIKGLGDIAPEIETIVRSVGEKIPAAVAKASRVLITLVDNVGSLITVFKGLLALRLTLFFTSLIRQVLALGVALGAARGGLAGLLGTLAGLGLSFVAIEAISAKLTDNLDESSGATSKLARASNEVRSVIETVNNKVSEFTANLDEAGRRVIRVAAINRLTSQQAVETEKLAAATEKLARAQADIDKARSIRTVGRSIQIPTNIVDDAAAARDEAQAGIDALQEEIDKLKLETELTVSPAVAALDASALTTEQQALLDGALTTKVAVELLPVGGFNLIEARAADAAAKFTTAFEAASNRFQNIGFLKEFEADADALTESTRELISNLSSISDTADKAFSQIQELGITAFNTITDSATDFFTSFITGAESAREAFRSLIADILSQITRLALNKAFDSLRGSLFGGAGTGAAAAIAPPGQSQITLQVVNNYGTVDLSGDIQDQLDRQSDRISELTLGNLQRAVGSDTRTRRAIRAALA